MITGYTSGVFDLFHIGHVNLLRNAKSLCDKLIVAVSVDDLVRYKHKKPVIPFNERIEIIKSIKYVDTVIPQYDLDKYSAWRRLKFDILFVGDDWYNKDNWIHLDEKLSKNGVKVIYLPYTRGRSSTLINNTLNRLRDGHN